MQAAVSWRAGLHNAGLQGLHNAWDTFTSAEMQRRARPRTWFRHCMKQSTFRRAKCHITNWHDAQSIENNASPQNVTLMGTASLPAVAVCKCCRSNRPYLPVEAQAKIKPNTYSKKASADTKQRIPTFYIKQTTNRTNLVLRIWINGPFCLPISNALTGCFCCKQRNGKMLNHVWSTVSASEKFCCW